MTPDEIKARLDEKGITQADLVRRFQKSKTAIHFLVHRQLKSTALDKRLARVLGVTLAELRGGRDETRKAS